MVTQFSSDQTWALDCHSLFDFLLLLFSAFILCRALKNLNNHFAPASLQTHKMLMVNFISHENDDGRVSTFC